MTNKAKILCEIVNANIYAKSINKETLSESEIDDFIEYCSNSPQFRKEPFSKEELEQVKNKIHADFLIKLDLGVSLVEKNHEKWFEEAKNGIDMNYWSRYKDYLLQDKGFFVNVVKTMDEVSDDLTDLLGNPKSNFNFQRRGLIIGDVQSGKTANYTGLICKAADVGYKAIVLLTGTIEDLRQQTQIRLDEGFIGRDSNDMFQKRGEDVFIGVGKHDNRFTPAAFTSKMQDFNTKSANNLRLTLDTLTEPAIFVIKKNVSVLKQLNSWFKNYNMKDGQLINASLLVVDDESDFASINVRCEDEEPTVINNQIRTMLSLFSKASYVGFTATPFANIFINPDTNEDMKTEDLFPKDYIYCLDAPSNYIGARNIFGDNAEYGYMLQTIKDGEIYFPAKHKKDDVFDSLSPSLKKAIRQFFIANVIRDLRGDITTHRSMIVNLSRFVAIQKHIFNMIESYVEELKNSIKLYSKLNFDQAMKDDNLNEFYNTFQETYFELGYIWNDIQNMLEESTKNIIINIVNSKGPNKLNYNANKKTGLRVIVVGGMSLSRGLTLEGLIISYFYRNSKMYDTLMQMGRWFGYRPNYDDLCRIWMDEDNESWYEHISEATDELKRDVKRMREMDKTPLEFGLRVRNDVDSLLITARNKMRTANEYEHVISMSETYLEMTKIYNDDFKNKANLFAVRDLLSNIQNNNKTIECRGSNKGYKDVPKQIILDFLNSFDSSYANFPFDVFTLSEFIESYISGELSKWDIVFISGDSKDKFYLDSTNSINCVKRGYSPRNGGKLLQMSGKKNRLGTANDAKFALDQNKLIEVENNFHMLEKNYDKAVPQREYFKCKRNPLLMIYLISLGDNRSEELVDLKVHEPLVGISIGFPSLPNISTKYAKYKINIIKLRNQNEFEEVSSDIDDEDGNN